MYDKDDAVLADSKKQISFDDYFLGERRESSRRMKATWFVYSAQLVSDKA